MYQIRNIKIKILMLIIGCMVMNANYANDEFHQSLTEILSESVNDGQVNYKVIKNSPKFYNYVESLKAESIFPNKNEELAFWINSYNALAIKGILDGLSPRKFLGRIKYFKSKKYQVGGKNINLYDLERKVIIPLGEPRIHFAINCASVSCPKISSEAYTTQKLDAQLESVTKEFINDQTKNTFNTKTKVASISKIFDWFENDFINHSGSIDKYLAQYVADVSISEDLRNGEYKIRYLKYDWNLNGTKP